MHLVVMILQLINSEKVPQFFIDFHDFESFEDYRWFILQIAPQF